MSWVDEIRQRVDEHKRIVSEVNQALNKVLADLHGAGIHAACTRSDETEKTWELQIEGKRVIFNYYGLRDAGSQYDDSGNRIGYASLEESLTRWILNQFHW